MIVKKSDGLIEDYDVLKVKNGISDAYTTCGEPIDNGVIESISANLIIYDKIETSEIRRQVEDALISVNKKVAKAYIKKYDVIVEGKKQIKKKDDFINNYIKASNAATGSKFDSNANVTSKNIVTMGQEMYKDNNIRQNRWMIRDKMKSMYNKKLADNYVSDLDSHRLYKHDETAIPGMPYTYSAKEVIEVRYNDRHLLLPFDKLWDYVEEKEYLVNKTDTVYQKQPNDLMVKDYNDVFTKVSIITKKMRKRDLVIVKTLNGEDVVVTDNHPMITNLNDINDTVEAIKSKDKPQYKIGETFYFGDITEIELSNKTKLILTEDFGYNLGAYLINNDNKLNLSNKDIKIVLSYLNIDIENINLPYNILDLNEQFVKGLVNGIIITFGGDNIITSKSRSFILQLTSLLRNFGYNVENVYDGDVWGVKYDTNSESKYVNVDITNISEVSKIDGSFLNENEFIYDITTETRTFACNNLLVHNCVAITMYPYLVDGLTKLGGSSTKPTDLKSFCGGFVNLVYSVSSQFAGACLYKDQHLMINNNGLTHSITAKEFVNKFDLNNKFENYQGEWEYADISNYGYKVAEDGKYVDIKKVYRRKYNKEIYKITTKNGYSALTSGDHRFKTLFRGRETDFKANELNINDTLFMNKDFSLYYDKNSDDFKLGYIIGMLCGDGSLTDENQIRLSVNYEQIYLAETFNEYFLKLFGKELHQNNGHKCYDYRLYSTEIYPKIKEYINGTNTYDKHIDVNDDLSVEYMIGFLDGLFAADGSYTETKGVTITLTNLQLIKNIEDILTKIMFPYTEHVPVNDKRENKSDSYSLYIGSKIIKYLVNTPRKIIGVGKKSNIDSSREIYYYGKYAFKNAKSNTRTDVQLIKDNKLHNELKTDVIDNIETFMNDDEYVYEIETSSHWYNCGGFITHNCATPEFLMYMDYFIRNDYGQDYLTHLSDKVEYNKKSRSLEKVIENCFQQVVHSMNMPAGNRG